MGFQIGAKPLQVEAKIFQIMAENTNRGMKDYKPGQVFQIGAGIKNRCGTT